MGRLATMRAVFLCALAALPALVSAASAWNDFVSHTAPVEAPKGSVGALNLATFANPMAHTAVTYVQPGCSSSSTTDDCRAVTVNSLIGSGTPAEINKKICKKCKAAALGTDFYSTMASFDCNAVSDTNPVPPQCMSCLTKGFGSTEATPGFYLPCGCQGTCVDVSGNSTANFAKAGLKGSTLSYEYKFASTDMPTTNQELAMRYSKGYPLTTCQDYITNKIVLTCNQISIFHFVLWPSVLGGAALLFTAMSMSYMQLDMDSLLYTVGSSGKKDN